MEIRKYVIGILVLWLSIISLWVIRSEYTLHFGRTVLLKTVPVDPNDIFMGDYVNLNYEISQIQGYTGFKNNQPVYVYLKVDKSNVGHIDYISSTDNKNRQLFIKGIKQNGNFIKYGIESYYVKYNTGHKLEQDLQNGAYVKVNIDRYGNAKVKGFTK